MQYLEFGARHGLLAVARDCSWVSDCDRQKTFQSGRSKTVKRLRLQFLGGVALGVVLLSASDPAYAQCSIAGSVQTCSGNLSKGVVVTDPAITRLRVDRLTRNITPATGVEGIKFESNAPIVVMLDFGKRRMEVDGANGVQLRGLGGNDVSLTSHGGISVTNGLGVYLTSAGSIYLDNDGNIKSDGDSVRVVNESVHGGGTTSIIQDGKLRSFTGYGIYSEGQNATYIDSDGAIHSDRDSIFVKVGAEGTIDIAHKGALTSDSGYGVNVSEAYGNVFIDVSGNIVSGLDGIYAQSADFYDPPSGPSLLSVRHAGRINAGGSGINVGTSRATLDVENKGKIVSVDAGIKLTNNSTEGSFVRQTGDITSAEGEGVNVYARGQVDIKTAGNITAKRDGLSGISIEGDVEIGHKGNITSSTANGVYAEAANGTVDVTVSNGNISASGAGIYTQSGGANTVILKGNIRQSATGIYAHSTNGPVTVSAAGNVTAAGDGIFAQNDSAGKIKVEQTGALNVGGAGINAYSASGEIEIDQHGAIAAGGNGIYAENTGDLAINIERTGNISSATANGIYATSSGGAITVKSAHGNLSVAQTGIYAGSTGYSPVSIDFKGNITRSAVALSGYSSNGAVSIVSSGSLTADGDAIVAENEGNSSISVNHSGAISSGGVGINAKTPLGAVTVEKRGTINAVGDAIRAANTSDSTVTVTNSGNLASTTGSGIVATSSTGAVNVTSEAGNISAAEYGIYAESMGSSPVTISVDGNVGGSIAGIYSLSGGANTIDLTGNIANSATGIFAKSTGGPVTVAATGNVSVTGDAISVENRSSGKVKIDHTGTLTAGGAGINAYSSNGEIEIDQRGAIVAGGDGIFAENRDSSTVSINHSGSITAGGAGINAKSSNGAVTVTKDGHIQAAGNAISAASTDYRTVTVANRGNLVSTAGSGIVASSSNGVVNVTSVEGNISAAAYGIHAVSTGASPVTVSMTGNILQSQAGILATSSVGDVTVTTVGSMTSSGDVLTASNRGDGTVRIDHSGNVTSSGGNGVVATSTTGLVDVDVASDAINVAGTAIQALNLGTTAVNVNFTGNVTGSAKAIDASSALGAVTVTTVGNLVSTGDTITASNKGGQPVVVTHEGNLTSTEGNAVVASSTDAVVTVTLDKGEVKALKHAVNLTGFADLDVIVGKDGTVTGGAGFAAINFEQGYQNTITNHGTIRTAGTMSDFAIKATASENIIGNYGTISGSVDVGEWANAFNNYEGGLFEAGTVVRLGDDSIMSNAGIMSPGGNGTIQTTVLTGVLVNTETGTLLLDLDMATGNGDLIEVSNTADLDGSIRLNFLNLTDAGSTYTMLTAANGIGTQNLTLANPTVLYDIAYGNDGKQVDVTINGFDFAPSGITGNALGIGTYVTNAVASGDLNEIALALLQMQTVEDVQEALSQLSPNAQLTDQASSLPASLSFSNNLMSCSVAGGAVKFGAEGQCVWARTDYRWVEHEGPNATGFSDRIWEATAGAQYALDADWRIGAAFGATTSSRVTDGGQTVDGTAFQLGGVVKYVPGPMLFAASLSGTYGNYDSSRSVNIGDLSETLESSRDSGTINGRLRAAHTVDFGDTYLKPQVDLNATYWRTSSSTESGGVAALHINGDHGMVYSVAPSIEIGGQYMFANGMALRPFVRGGVTAHSENSTTVSGYFLADTNGQDPFEVTSRSDDIVWNVSAGFDAFATNGAALRVFYNGNFSEYSNENAIGLKLKMDY